MQVRFLLSSIHCNNTCLQFSFYLVKHCICVKYGLSTPSTSDGTGLLPEISRSVCYYRIMTVNRNLGPIINHHRRQPKFTPSKIWGCRLGLEDGDPVYEPDSPLRSRSTYQGFYVESFMLPSKQQLDSQDRVRRLRGLSEYSDNILLRLKLSFSTESNSHVVGV